MIDQQLGLLISGRKLTERNGSLGRVDNHHATRQIDGQDGVIGESDRREDEVPGDTAMTEQCDHVAVDTGDVEHGFQKRGLVFAVSIAPPEDLLGGVGTPSAQTDLDGHIANVLLHPVVKGASLRKGVVWNLGQDFTDLRFDFRSRLGGAFLKIDDPTTVLLEASRRVLELVVPLPLGQADRHQRSQVRDAGAPILSGNRFDILALPNQDGLLVLDAAFGSPFERLPCSRSAVMHGPVRGQADLESAQPHRGRPAEPVPVREQIWSALHFDHFFVDHGADRILGRIQAHDPDVVIVPPCSRQRMVLHIARVE